MPDWTKDWYTTRYVLRRGWKWLVLALFGLLLTPLLAWSAATLENPTSGAIKSGVGLLSGWVCDANRLEVSFDGGPRLFVPYGSERTDTAYTEDGTEICGDTDNGFGLLINYSELGDGPHTATLYVDGVLTTRVNFTVVTLGTNFLRGVTGQGHHRALGRQASQRAVGGNHPGLYHHGIRRRWPFYGRRGAICGNLEFTSGQITQTYTFGNPEPCWVDLSNAGLQCVQDYNTLATLGPDTMTGYTSPYEYALIHADGETCRAFFLDEPTGGVVEGDYGPLSDRVLILLW